MSSSRDKPLLRYLLCKQQVRYAVRSLFHTLYGFSLPLVYGRRHGGDDRNYRQQHITPSYLKIAIIHTVSSTTGSPSGFWAYFATMCLPCCETLRRTRPIDCRAKRLTSLATFRAMCDHLHQSRHFSPLVVTRPPLPYDGLVLIRRHQNMEKPTPRGSLRCGVPSAPCSSHQPTIRTTTRAVCADVTKGSSSSIRRLRGTLLQNRRGAYPSPQSLEGEQASFLSSGAHGEHAAPGVPGAVVYELEEHSTWHNQSISPRSTSRRSSSRS